MSTSEVHEKSVVLKKHNAAAALEIFISDIVDLALSVEPKLAEILSTGSAPSTPAKPWTGGRRRGLELCLNMLRYARAEVARGRQSDRLDHAEAHVRYELAKIYEVEGRHMN